MFDEGVGVPRVVVRELPLAPGVYRFRDGKGRVLYLGRATNLRRRVASYWGPLRGRRHLARMVVQIDRIEAVECDSLHEAAWLELLLMRRSKPRWNRSIGGQEVPVLVRLDPSPRTPGLTLAHDAVDRPLVRYFGPYLGGNQLRVALRALHRVSPLALAGSTQSGSVRDMARVRSITADRRDALVERIDAVLHRDPDAVLLVRRELAELRDEASARLKFELAASIHDELQALDWLVAPQRVMVAGGGSQVFTGWANGFAADFRMTEGAVDGWSIRRSSEAAVAARLSVTPDSWRRWADRSALLASRLAAAGPD